MKKLFAGKLWLLLMIVLFASCKKEIDQPFVEEPGVAKKKSPAECKILSITSFGGIAAGEMHWTFEYNSNSNPISVIIDQEGTGNPNLYFRYDDNNRLTDIIGLYGVLPGAGGYEFWQVLEYNSEGIITGSTSYIWGHYGEEPDPNSFYIYSTDFTYDEEGRILEYSVFDEPISLQYDSKGNLVLSGKKYKYDNRNNIRQTHPIWMFFDKNYSLNNPVGDLEYNHSKYPVQFDSPSSFLGKSFDKATIVYDCP